LVLKNLVAYFCPKFKNMVDATIWGHLESNVVCKAFNSITEAKGVDPGFSIGYLLYRSTESHMSFQYGQFTLNSKAPGGYTSHFQPIKIKLMIKN